ncbi:hypothetical protein ALC56_02155 [Trachymyrmex septentrionalis]|uniref:Uncharacterized protein n=1 Tax=Trachymyrmex septentrionalis TaxID=34720 RepID=A0A195FU66_9HYME|nr:hypothetical protein ALC56_02155 [Trachymyrmex septentrionalis]
MWHRLTVLGCNDPRGTKLGHPRLFHDVVPTRVYTVTPFSRYGDDDPTTVASERRPNIHFDFHSPCPPLTGRFKRKPRELCPRNSNDPECRYVSIRILTSVKAFTSVNDKVWVRNESFEGYVFQKLKRIHLFALIRLVRIHLQTTRTFVWQIREE